MAGPFTNASTWIVYLFQNKKKDDLPFELHLFQDGEHGMSVCNKPKFYNAEAQKLNEENPNVRMWVPMCVNYFYI